jgi:radical SAM superfamily enzyme YgiQ (UPF0313 family)
MKLLLTTSAAPDISPFFTTEKRPPLGLGFLIATARKAGHEVFFIDNYLKPSTFIADGFLQQKGIELVGIYTNTICFADTLRMLKEMQALREKGTWRGKIAVGGPHASIVPGSFPDYVDYIVQGEGEEVLLQILEGKITTRIIRGGKVRDMDALPFQPWEIFAPMAYDFTCPWMEGEPVFTMNTSRGCPFNCSFCSVGSVWGRHYSYFSGPRIIEEIEHLIKTYNARGIYFREDNFTLNEKRTRAFCEGLLQKNINISWACETRVDNLSRELTELMGRAGCRAFYLGIESGSPRVLDILNKGITLEQIKNVIDWSKKAGINAYCSLIAGVPGETFWDYYKTVRLMKRLKPYRYSFNVFVGLPDSPLYRQVKQNRLYEHEDANGLLYLPGYDVKANYFYRMDSAELVEHRFKERNAYDRYLQLILLSQQIIKSCKHIARIFLQKFLGVQGPFFKKGPGRRRHK